jgi:hypothetical protein
MSKQRLHANLAPIDILTRVELEETMTTKMDTYIRDLYRGVSYHEENGNGDGAHTIAIQGPESGYAWSVKIVAAQLTAIAGTVPSQPAVPASTVAQQNTNAYPVQVVISGGTATSTSVNGVVVGAGDGTFVVPAYGSISVTYSVAPTWVWSNVGGSTPDNLAVYLGDNLITAPIAAVPALPAFGSFYAIQRYTSNVVVLKDSRTLTLASTNGIFAYKLISKMVPAEMVAKL